MKRCRVLLGLTLAIVAVSQPADASCPGDGVAVVNSAPFAANASQTTLATGDIFNKLSAVGFSGFYAWRRASLNGTTADDRTINMAATTIADGLTLYADGIVQNLSMFVTGRTVMMRDPVSTNFDAIGTSLNLGSCTSATLVGPVPAFFDQWTATQEYFAVGIKQSDSLCGPANGGVAVVKVTGTGAARALSLAYLYQPGTLGAVTGLTGADNGDLLISTRQPSGSTLNTAQRLSARCGGAACGAGGAIDGLATVFARNFGTVLGPLTELADGSINIVNANGYVYNVAATTGLARSVGTFTEYLNGSLKQATLVAVSTYPNGRVYAVSANNNAIAVVLSNAGDSFAQLYSTRPEGWPVTLAPQQLLDGTQKALLAVSDGYEGRVYQILDATTTPVARITNLSTSVSSMLLTQNTSGTLYGMFTLLGSSGSNAMGFTQCLADNIARPAPGASHLLAKDPSRAEMLRPGFEPITSPSPPRTAMVGYRSNDVHQVTGIGGIVRDPPPPAGALVPLAPTMSGTCTPTGCVGCGFDNCGPNSACSVCSPTCTSGTCTTGTCNGAGMCMVATCTPTGCVGCGFDNCGANSACSACSPTCTSGTCTTGTCNAAGMCALPDGGTCTPTGCTGCGTDNCGANSACSACSPTCTSGTCTTGTCTAAGSCCVSTGCTGCGTDNCGSNPACNACSSTCTTGTCASGFCYAGSCCTPATCGPTDCGLKDDGCGGTVDCSSNCTFTPTQSEANTEITQTGTGGKTQIPDPMAPATRTFNLGGTATKESLGVLQIYFLNAGSTQTCSGSATAVTDLHYNRSKDWCVNGTHVVCIGGTGLAQCL